MKLVACKDCYENDPYLGHDCERTHCSGVKCFRQARTDRLFGGFPICYGCEQSFCEPCLNQCFCALCEGLKKEDEYALFLYCNDCNGEHLGTCIKCKATACVGFLKEEGCFKKEDKENFVCNFCQKK